MPQVVSTEPSDEIVDLVDKVRSSPEKDVALVINAGTAGMQSSMNARLLRQLALRAGKTVSVISADPYIQELSRTGGLPTFGSVPAFERGVQSVQPTSSEDIAAVAAAASAAPVAAPISTAPPVPVAPVAPPPPVPPTPFAPVRQTVARPAATAPVAAAAAGNIFSRNRRRWSIAAAAFVVLAILLFLFVAPSAKVSITLVGTPLTVNPTIQGSPTATSGTTPDHIATSVVSSDQQSQFQATPTGQKKVDPTAATATEQFKNKIPQDVAFKVPKGTEFDTSDGSIKFYATQDTNICLGASGGAPTTCKQSDTAPVQDGTPEAKGSVGANSITKWPNDPCPAAPSIFLPGGCSASDLTVTNPAAASGGADPKNLVVASDKDLAGWTSQVTQMEQTLTTQINSDLQNKAQGKTLAKDPSGAGTTVKCDANPALPAANAEFAATQITVACHGKAAAYNPADITTDVKTDLQAQVAQGETLATESITCNKPSVTQAADDGTVVLSVSCTSFSRPGLDTESLKKQLTGKSPGDARNLIQRQLNRVQNVSISQSPIPSLWLPFFSSRIEIDQTFVAQTGP